MKRTTNQQNRQNINRGTRVSLLLALLLTVVTTFSFANGNDGITRQVETSFRQDFKNGQIISAEVHTKFTKLTFKMNDIVLFAFYSESGRLLAVVRNILSNQLPLQLQMELKNRYSDYWITELFEINGDGQNCYYLVMEDADRTITLRSNGDDNWEVYDNKAKK